MLMCQLVRNHSLYSYSIHLFTKIDNLLSKCNNEFSEPHDGWLAPSHDVSHLFLQYIMGLN